jgi:outer membrane protein
VGVNYTTFWGERLYAVPDASLELDDSVGVAGNVGVDFKLNATDALRLNARYIDLKTDATVTVNGESTKLGEVDISPWVYGVSYVKSV